MHAQRPCRLRRGAIALILCVLSAVSAGGDLNNQAAQLARKHLAKMGAGYVAQIDGYRRIVYVSALDGEHLRRTQLLISLYLDAQKKTLFAKPLPWNLSVILPTTDDFRRLAENIKTKDCRGFYVPGQRKLISIDRGSVLIHEFTHALHHADAADVRQVHPIWIKEGLATLFESSSITPAGLEPSVGARLRTVQAAIRKGTLVPMDRLLSMGPRSFMSDANLHYAQARYVMLYLQRKNRLRSWYADYKKNYSKDTTGRAALQRALGNRVDLIERDWKNWIVKLKLPLGTYAKGQARLGLEVKDDRRGVKVVGVKPGSSAAAAGRIRKGDIITILNGRKTGNPALFVAAVRSAGANQTVKVELIRHGRRQTVLQPLGAPNTKP